VPRGANNAVGDPLNADTTTIDTAAGKVLTAVTVGNDGVTIDFIGLPNF
jgi:hypothetical protein